MSEPAEETFDQRTTEPPAVALDLRKESNSGPILCALIGIMALAFVVRSIPLDAGFPQMLRSPEERWDLQRALGIAKGDLNPGFFIYPSVHYYLMGASLRLRYGSEIGADPRGNLSTDYAHTSRSLSLLLGLVTVLGMFFAGRALRGDGAGLLAALITAVNPIDLAITTDTTVDAGMGAFMAWAFYAILLVREKPSLWRCVLAGALAGLATGCKQPGLALFGVLFAAYFLATLDSSARPLGSRPAVAWTLIALLALLAVGCFLVRLFAVDYVAERIIELANVPSELVAERRTQISDAGRGMSMKVGVLAAVGAALLGCSGRLRRVVVSAPIVVGIAAGVVVFAATSPFMFIEWRQSLRGVVHLVYQGTSVGWGPGLLTQSAKYFQSLAFGFGYAWWFFALAYAVVSIVRKSWGGVVVSIAGGGYFFAFAGHSTPLPHYMLPASLALTLLCAAGLASAWSILGSGRFGQAAWTLLAVWTCLVPVVSSARWVREKLAPNSATRGLEWMEANLPKGAVIVRSKRTPQVEVLGTHFQVRYVGYALERFDREYFEGMPTPFYVVISESLVRTFESNPSAYAKELAGIRYVTDNMELLKTIGDDDPREENRIDIYRPSRSEPAPPTDATTINDPKKE